MLCSRHLNESRRRDARDPSVGYCQPWCEPVPLAGLPPQRPPLINATRERLQQTLYPRLMPIFKHSQDRARLCRSLDHWIDELAGLARSCRKAASKSE